MHFFLLLLIPAVTACIISTDSKYGMKKLSTPIFLGSFAGMIVSAFIEFFINSENNPGSTFISIMLPMSANTLTPSILITALFLFFSKDDNEYKTYSVFPLLAAFYSVFVPYMTLSQWEKDSFFMNFISPVLYIETIILFSCAVKHGIRNFGKATKGKMAVTATAALFSLLFQPAIHAFWYLQIITPVVYILAVLLLPVSIFVYKFFCKQ